MNAKLNLPCFCCGGTGRLVGWEALRPYRQYLGVATRDVATELNVSQCLISLAERGERKINKPEWHARYIQAVDTIRKRKSEQPMKFSPRRLASEAAR